MSDDIPLGPEDHEQVLAAEFALGVLEGDELAEARRRMLADPRFADAVEAWSVRLAALGAEVSEQIPRPEVWDGIARRIEAFGDAAPVPIETARKQHPPGSVSGWGMALSALGGGAAAVAIMLAIGLPGSPGQQPPVEQAARTGPQLVAQLAEQEGERQLVSLIDARGDRLALQLAGFEPEAGMAPELWVIPDGGAPVSLGLLPESGRFERRLTERERALLINGATLAVTIETRAGAPHAEPSTPIVLVGSLSQI